jgi:hypothetical protein
MQEIKTESLLYIEQILNTCENSFSEPVLIHVLFVAYHLLLFYKTCFGNLQLGHYKFQFHI